MFRPAWLLLSLVACDGGEREESGAPDDSETASGTAPIANAGPDATVQAGDDLLLDGWQSADPNNVPIDTFEWTVASQPEGGDAVIDAADARVATFRAGVAGTYQVALRVRNAAGEWDETADVAVVTVTRPAVDADLGLLVYVRWDNLVDLDLHLRNGDAALWSVPGDCNYCNKAPDWGVASVVEDNCSFVQDVDSEGYGPEILSVREPADGHYTVAVHFYSDVGEFAGTHAPAEVEIFSRGDLIYSGTSALQNRDDVWDVATVTFPGATVEVLDRARTTTQSWCDVAF